MEPESPLPYPQVPATCPHIYIYTCVCVCARLHSVGRNFFPSFLTIFHWSFTGNSVVKLNAFIQEERSVNSVKFLKVFRGVNGNGRTAFRYYGGHPSTVGIRVRWAVVSTVQLASFGVWRAVGQEYGGCHAVTCRKDSVILVQWHSAISVLVSACLRCWRREGINVLLADSPRYLLRDLEQLMCVETAQDVKPREMKSHSWISPFKSDFSLNRIQNIILCLTENTVCVHYKDRRVNVV